MCSYPTYGEDYNTELKDKIAILLNENGNLTYNQSPANLCTFSSHMVDDKGCSFK